MTWLGPLQEIQERILSVLAGKPDDGHIPTPQSMLQFLLATCHRKAPWFYSVLDQSTAFKNTLAFLIAALFASKVKVECYRYVVYKTTSNGEKRSKQLSTIHTSLYEERWLRSHCQKFSCRRLTKR